MFKKASLKIANNSTSTSSSNQDVRPIQCLLTAEKAVLLSNRLQKLSVDYAKAAEALKTWGLSEDNDLGGILTASTSLFNHFSLALSQYASHGSTMQRQLEVMAKKGESLDNLKQRRKSAHQKAEDTAHQLNKMNPDNKYYSMHADALKRLRKDVRKMDEDIRLEENILIDHKQTATKVWMRLKFGGLYECCEKGSIAGKYGKLVTSEFEGFEDINQPGMPRNIQLQNKIESFIMEADRNVNAVGISVVGSRNGDRNFQGSSNAPSAGPYSSSPTSQETPHLPPKPENAQPFRSGNGHFPERQDSSFQPSSGYSYAPPSHQQLPSQGSRTSPPSQQLPRVTEGDLGAVPSPNNGRGQFGSSEFGGQSLGGPAVDGRRRDTSFSESNAGPSRFPDQTPPSHWQQPPNSSQWQNPYQSYPVHLRPPTESGYPPQDPPPQGVRNHVTSESSYSTGPPQWQTQPVVMRPPGSSDGYPPSQSGSSLNGDSSYSAGSSHVQSPPRPPGSSDGYPHTQGGSNVNGNSSYPAGPSHVQGAPRPISSGSGYLPSQGGSNPKSNPPYSAGPSHMQGPTSDRFTSPSRPPGPPEPGRYALQDPSPVGGRHPNESSSGGYPSHDPPPSHWQNHPSDRFPMPPPPPPALQPPLGGHPGNPSHTQGPINPGPNSSSDSGGYLSQVPPLDVRHRTGGSSFSESTNSQWTQPTTNRFNGGSESATVTSDGMSRPREGSFNNQSMNSWGGSHLEESPPAYVLEGNPGSIVPDTGSKGKKW